MIEDIKKNIDSEISMLREISIYTEKLDSAGATERQLLMNAISSLRESMRIVNDSIPALLNEISFDKDQASGGSSYTKKLERINFARSEGQFHITIPSKEKKLLLKELSIREMYIKRLRKRGHQIKEEYTEFKAARGYLKLSNKMFWNRALKAINKGHYKKLAKELQKANIDILSRSYVALIYTTVFFSIIVSLVITSLLFFFNIGLSWPIFTLYEGNYLNRLFQIFWIPLIIPLLVFTILYYYPVSEKKSLAKRINQELAFAVIHMSAISGSGIQPSEIFRIIGLSKEYPHLRKEIRKVLNQINLYGYDLVTALNNAAATTSSIKLAELFSGLSTTITSGGDLSEFFNKRSETLLADYRLERQKYSKTAETFMDIYISVVIAAPMILMLLLIMLTLGNFDIGLSTGQLTLLIISVISAINIVFLIFVHLNQPSY